MTENSVLPIGSITDDGTIYAGISPDTGKPMYVAPTDAPISVNFNAAARYATTLEVGDKIDFRVPTKAELNVLFENREKGALKGTFNTKFGTGEDTGPLVYTIPMIRLLHLSSCLPTAGRALAINAQLIHYVAFGVDL